MEDLAVLIQGVNKEVQEIKSSHERLTLQVQQGFEMTDKKSEAVQGYLEDRMDHQFEEIKKRTFNPEEKESLVAVIGAVNDRLENDALGKENITLTRPEYDATSIVKGFPNRFTTPVRA